MMRRTELKRTGFSRGGAGAGAIHAIEYQENREQRLVDRAHRAMKNAAKALGVAAMTKVSALPALAVVKEQPLRSERYRRLVACLPCAHCGIEGYSQHAHENDGKGKAMKVDDRRAMPLCCTRPGVEGCHTAFDQYRLLPGGREAHHAQGRAWSEQTRKRIYESGHWPKNVPLWQEGGSDAI